VAAFSNLKLHLLRPTGEVVPGEMIAKVVETLPEDVSRVVVSFTSIPETVRTFLDTIREVGIRHSASLRRDGLLSMTAGGTVCQSVKSVDLRPFWVLNPCES
jgi:hypothetical protein